MKLYCAFKLDTSLTTMVKHAMQVVNTPDLHPLELIQEDRIHITTAFLGEVSVEEAKEVLRESSDEFEFYCRVGAPGSFPGVLYLSVESVGAYRVRSRQADVYLKECGRKLWPAQYVPHVTLAKRIEGTKVDASAALGKAMLKLRDFVGGACLVKSIGLYHKSECLYELPLREGA